MKDIPIVNLEAELGCLDLPPLDAGRSPLSFWSLACLLSSSCEK